MKNLIVVTSTLLFVGCSTMYYEHTYRRPNTTNEQTQQDLQACGQWAQRNTIGFYSPWGVTEAISSKAQQCMLAKGYVWEVQ